MSPAVSTAAPPAGPIGGTGWLPSGAQLVLRIRFSELRGSALFRKLMASKPLFGDELTHVDRFVSRARLDPSRDVDVVWIATDGAIAGESAAILTTGLDRRTLGERLARAGAQTYREGDVTVYALAAESAAGSSAGAAPTAGTVAALPREGVAVVGTRAWVRLSLERVSGGGKSLSESPTLGPLLRRIDEKATIWSAAASRAIEAKVRSEFQNGVLGPEDLGSMRSLVAAFRIASDVRFDSEATTATGEDADLLAIVLRGMIAMGGLQAGSDEDLAELFHNLRIDRTAGGIRLTGQIPASVAMRL